MLASAPGCKTAVVRRSVEKRMQRRLVALLGPAESYRVRILETRDPELVLGRARRVEVEGIGIQPEADLVIDHFRLTMADVRYEGGEPEFVDVRRSDLAVRVSEAAVNRYAASRLPRNRPELRIRPGEVQVRMIYPFLRRDVALTARGRLVVREGRQLLFDAESAEVPFASSPAAAEKFVEDRLNPLLDLSRFGHFARLEEVILLDGALEARGSAGFRREVGHRREGS